MNKQTLLLLFFISSRMFAQLPDTDIFLADVKNKDGKITFTHLRNITARTGYDNQPSFSPDGKSMLYVSARDTVQTDVYRYDIISGKISQVTKTPESEYSPSFTPDAKNITVVRVDLDKGQRSYNFPVDATSHSVRISGTDSIGYYCSLNDSLLAMFILGDANTLQVLNLHAHERKLIASDIGRCFKLNPQKNRLFFVLKQNSSEWGIFSMNVVTYALEKVVATLKDTEDFAFLPDGTLLMGSDGKLFKYKPGTDQYWQVLADFSSTLKSFYRISVSPSGDKIALVAYSGKKP